MFLVQKKTCTWVLRHASWLHGAAILPCLSWTLDLNIQVARVWVDLGAHCRSNWGKTQSCCRKDQNEAYCLHDWWLMLESKSVIPFISLDMKGRQHMCFSRLSGLFMSWNNFCDQLLCIVVIQAGNSVLTEQLKLKPFTAHFVLLQRLRELRVAKELRFKKDCQQLTWHQAEGRMSVKACPKSIIYDLFFIISDPQNNAYYYVVVYTTL